MRTHVVESVPTAGDATTAYSSMRPEASCRQLGGVHMLGEAVSKEETMHE